MTTIESPTITKIELPGCPWWCEVHPDPAEQWECDEVLQTKHVRYFGAEGIAVERWDTISVRGEFKEGATGICAGELGHADAWDDMSAEVAAERAGWLNEAAAFVRGLR